MPGNNPTTYAVTGVRAGTGPAPTFALAPTFAPALLCLPVTEKILFLLIVE